jgi:hypothetical protein
VKVKQAVEVLTPKKDNPGQFSKEILDIYLREFDSRRKLRFGGRYCRVSSFESLNKEMAEWIEKVMLGCGLPVETAKTFSQRLRETTTEVINKAPKKVSINAKPTSGGK